MKLEVLLSVMNLKRQDLDKMNITSDCIVINQCKKNDFEKYNNFKIYSYDEIGISNSRNRALEHASLDILLFCDDDIVYNSDYENIVLNEFYNNKDADIIFFNFDSPNRYQKKNTKNKRLHIYNSLKYGTFNIAIRRESLLRCNIKFNTLFGSKKNYHSGEDTLFIVDCLKNNLNLYSSTKNIGIVYQKESTWFKGYNKKYFFDKGALFCAISKHLRYLLFIQYLLRHKEVLIDIKFIDAYKQMIDGANSYLRRVYNDKCSSSNI